VETSRAAPKGGFGTLADKFSKVLKQTPRK
jgi:hypothetical protein